MKKPDILTSLINQSRNIKRGGQKGNVEIITTPDTLKGLKQIKAILQREKLLNINEDEPIQGSDAVEILLEIVKAVKQ